MVAYTLLANHVPLNARIIGTNHVNFDDDFTPVDFARLRQQLSSEAVSRLDATTDR